MKEQEKLYQKIPKTPGVYLMKDAQGKILYIGKAGNLKRRISSYFQKANEYRIEKLLRDVKRIAYKKTDTALEALILESALIKKYTPPYNVREKDDKSFLYIEITKEKFPRVLLVRGKSRSAGEHYGPFTSASSIREALKILRRIFPFSTHDQKNLGKFKRPCFEYEIGLCPGTCIGAIGRSEYLANIRNLRRIFQGKRRQIVKSLEKEMRAASRALEFEKAEKLRRQIFALQHIQDIALITDDELPTSNLQPPTSYRIEGYDISDISGTSATGSMVMFEGERPNKNEYRKFKVQSITEPNDVGMMREVLRRRFHHPEWPLPNLILVDGGKGQVNAARAVLGEFGLKIPVVGIAKGPKRKRNDLLGMIPQGVTKKILIKVRDEAHRFALSYHKKLRHISFLRTRV